MRKQELHTQDEQIDISLQITLANNQTYRVVVFFFFLSASLQTTAPKKPLKSLSFVHKCKFILLEECIYQANRLILHHFNVLEYKMANQELIHAPFQDPATRTVTSMLQAVLLSYHCSKKLPFSRLAHLYRYFKHLSLLY